jgi:uncharacterized protein (TIGR03067 family)
MLLVESRERVLEEVVHLDHTRLQGRWKSIAGQRAAEFVIDGDQYLLRFGNGDTYEGSFCIYPTQRPRAMDMTIQEGPERNRGKTALAIYQIDSDHLIWAPSEPGSNRRLCAFPPEGDRETLCVVFHRVEC